MGMMVVAGQALREEPAVLRWGVHMAGPVLRNGGRACGWLGLGVAALHLRHAVGGAAAADEAAGLAGGGIGREDDEILLVVVGYQNDVAIVAGRHRALGVLDGASVRPDLNGAEEGGGPGGAISHVEVVDLQIETSRRRCRRGHGDAGRRIRGRDDDGLDLHVPAVVAAAPALELVLVALPGRRGGGWEGEEKDGRADPHPLLPSFWNGRGGEGGLLLIIYLIPFTLLCCPNGVVRMGCAIHKCYAYDVRYSRSLSVSARAYVRREYWVQAKSIWELFCELLFRLDDQRTGITYSVRETCR